MPYPMYTSDWTSADGDEWSAEQAESCRAALVVGGITPVKGGGVIIPKMAE